MFILFALVFMRMTGAIVMNPVLGRSNIPNRAKGAMILVLSFLMYAGTDGVLTHEPVGMLEFAVMLIKELMVGFAIGFSMELSFAVVRFSAAVLDYIMGLSMAQVYDPQYQTQMTITSGMYYTFLVLLFLAGDGHVRLLALIYSSARMVPFGQVMIRPEFELATSDMIVQFALRNLGVGCVVRDFARQYLEDGRLFELRFNRIIPGRHFCVVTNPRNPLSVAAKNMLDLL